MKKIIAVLCSILITITIQVNAADFVKIRSGLGLKEDGTIWKLPFEYNRMLGRFSESYKYQKEEPIGLTKIEHLNDIQDFEAYSTYVFRSPDIPDNEGVYVLSKIIYKTKETGITYGYTGYILDAINGKGPDIILDDVQKFSTSVTNSAIKNNNQVYLWGHVRYGGDPFVVDGLKDIVTVSTHNLYQFALDKSGQVYRFDSFLSEDKMIDPIKKPIEKISQLDHIQDLQSTTGKYLYCLDQNNTAFVCSYTSLEIGEPFQRITEVEDVKKIHCYTVSTTDETLDKNNYITFDHYAALKEDGTVWHFGYMADKNRHEIDENLTAEKNVIMKPVQIKGIDGVKQIDVLDENIFMLKEDGSIVLWGLDALENLHTDTPTPLETRNFYVYMDTASDAIEVNGHKSELDEGRGTKPVVMDGTVMVPVRNVVEKLGGQIGWEEQSRRVTIQLWDKEFKFQAGSDQILENGQYHALSKPSVVLDDRTMVPVDFFEKNMGCTLETQQQENSITVKFVYNKIL